MLAPLIRGVFPSDKLPVINTYPLTSLIANTDPYDKPGTHWVAMYFEWPHESELFDSYEFSSRDIQHGYFHCEASYVLQRQTTAGIRLRCLWRLLFFFYLLHRARNVDMNTIQSKFKWYDSQWNDVQVAHSMTKIKNETFLQSEQQGCKSLQCCRKQ